MIGGKAIPCPLGHPFVASCHVLPSLAGLNPDNLERRDASDNRVCVMRSKLNEVQSTRRLLARLNPAGRTHENSDLSAIVPTLSL